MTTILSLDSADVPADGDTLTYDAVTTKWTPTAPAGGDVASVNGQTGAVVLDAADVGAATTAQGALADTAVQPADLTPYATDADLAGYATTASLTSGLAGKSDTGHTHTAANVSDFTEASQDVVGAMVTAAGGTYNDAAGTITFPAASDGWTYVISTVDTSESAGTGTNITGLSIPTLANGLYEIEGRFICTSSALATGSRVGLANASTGADANLGIIASNGAASSVVYFPTLANMPGNAGTTQSSSSTGKYLGALLFGTVRAASMTGTIDLTITTEIAASAVTAKADSFIRYRKIAS